jgi:hypothetical protein
VTKDVGDIGAWDLMQQLQNDPAWVAQQDAREAETKANHERYLFEEAPLRRELHAAGFRVETVWDFVNAKENYYVDAIPILLSHLRRPYGDTVREGITRSLAMREARGIAGSAIVETLREDGLGQQLRWALANTLTTVADRTNRDDIKALLEAEKNSDVANRLNRALKTAAKP